MIMNDVAHEKEWIRQARHDPEAFRHLFDLYHDRIFNYALRRTCNVAFAKDVTANTFLHALENIRHYERRGVPFYSWLYRIATNEVNQFYRKRKRFVALTPEHEDTLKSEDGADCELLAEEAKHVEDARFLRIHAILTRLKPKYQAVIALRYFENLSIREIASILDISEENVKIRIHRGLNMIRALV